MGGEVLFDLFFFFFGFSLGGGKWNILYWVIWGFGEVENFLGVLGGVGVFCFFLILKYNVDLGIKG